MDIYYWFGIAAGLVVTFAFIPYILDIRKGKSTPQYVTWILWSILDWVLLESYYTVGAVETVWVPWAFAIGATITLAFSIKRGEWSWDWINSICLAAGICGIVGRFVYGVAAIGVFATLFALSMAAIPTMRSAFHNPEKESFIAWAMFGSAAVLNLFAVKWVGETSPNLEVWIFPVVVIFLDGIIAYLVCIRSKLAK